MVFFNLKENANEILNICKQGLKFLSFPHIWLQVICNIVYVFWKQMDNLNPNTTQGSTACQFFLFTKSVEI